jgi:hypothetical protein
VKLTIGGTQVELDAHAFAVLDAGNIALEALPDGGIALRARATSEPEIMHRAILPKGHDNAVRNFAEVKDKELSINNLRHLPSASGFSSAPELCLSALSVPTSAGERAPDPEPPPSPPPKRRGRPPKKCPSTPVVGPGVSLKPASGGAPAAVAIARADAELVAGDAYGLRRLLESERVAVGLPHGGDKRPKELAELWAAMGVHLRQTYGADAGTIGRIAVEGFARDESIDKIGKGRGLPRRYLRSPRLFLSPGMLERRLRLAAQELARRRAAPAPDSLAETVEKLADALGEQHKGAYAAERLRAGHLKAARGEGGRLELDVGSGSLQWHERTGIASAIARAAQAIGETAPVALIGRDEGDGWGRRTLVLVPDEREPLAAGGARR